MKVLITLFAVFAACLAVSYDGYRVLRVTPGTQDGVQKLQQLMEAPEVSIWKVHHEKEQISFDVMVSPSYYATFIRELERQIHTAAYLMINDVQEMIDQQLIENEIAKINAKSGEARIDNTFYRSLDEIYATLDTFAATYSFMSVYSIGTTYEGRDLKVLKVSTGGGDTRPVIWIDCGIHAREWVTPASCLFYIDSLSTYGTDQVITDLLDQYDFHILTVLNPDGYSFTWSDDRLWRKNRVPYNNCFGADINRNFGTGFGGSGSSNLACSETYHGPSAFSELESQALVNVITGFGSRIKSYYDMHSYSNLWMFANGYTTAPTPDNAEQNRVAKIGVDALTAVYGTSYAYGPISTTIYLASGGTVDWAYDPVGIVYSYTLEFRDTGTYGFLLPADQIVPTATETWTGVLAAIAAYQ